MCGCSKLTLKGKSVKVGRGPAAVTPPYLNKESLNRFFHCVMSDVGRVLKRGEARRPAGW